MEYDAADDVRRGPLSYNHHIVDGAEAFGFLLHIKNAIENPERMLLGL